MEPLREGRRKWAEQGTGALAFALARCFGVAAICTAGVQHGDPNQDLGSLYLRRVVELTEGPVLDLHMMRPRDFHVGLGLGPHPEMVGDLTQVLVKSLQTYEVRTAVNKPFRAAGVTLTAQLQRRGIPAVQIELSYECFDRSKGLMERTWVGLATAVQTMGGLGATRDAE